MVFGEHHCIGQNALGIAKATHDSIGLRQRENLGVRYLVALQKFSCASTVFNGNAQKLGLWILKRFLEQHGEGRFTMWHRAADDHSPKTLNRAGVRRMLNGDGEPIKATTDHQREFGERMPADLGENITFEYIVLPEAFKAELCNGFDAQTVARVLLDHGCLTVDQDRLTVKPRLPGIGHARCYHITPALFALDL